MGQKKKIKVLLVEDKPSKLARDREEWENGDDESVPDVIGFVYKYENRFHTTYFNLEEILNEDREIN